MTHRSQEEIEKEFSKLRMGDIREGGDTNEEDNDLGKEPGSTGNDGEAVKLDNSLSAEEAASLKEEGNRLYKSGEYQSAIDKYKRASESGHADDDARAVYLANLAAAAFKLQRWDEVVKAASTALKLKPGYSKALARRREARERLGDWRGALDDATSLKAPAADLNRLRLLAQEKERKDQEEALNSLKGLGNSILSNFGMSLDDFSFEKDAETGSYSVKTKK